MRDPELVLPDPEDDEPAVLRRVRHPLDGRERTVLSCALELRPGVPTARAPLLQVLHAALVG